MKRRVLGGFSLRLGRVDGCKAIGYDIILFYAMDLNSSRDSPSIVKILQPAGLAFHNSHETKKSVLPSLTVQLIQIKQALLGRMDHSHFLMIAPVRPV